MRESLVVLKEWGFVLCCVTNQSVVARGLLTLSELDSLHLKLNDDLGRGRPILDGFFACPHHPHAQVERYRVHCDCRKPKAGLLLQAAKRLGLDLMNSFMVGDRMSDVVAGDTAGCKTILFESGRHEDPPIVGAESSVSLRPDLRVQSWEEVVNWISSHRHSQSDRVSCNPSSRWRASS